ncbi:MAG: DUF3341 domain-containing protein [Bacteriovoracaceae bacterium]|jgi:hypothetical protein|nr:DUF3341 domain-containing protein [Bacteriovoracaceae bacterium]
MKKDFVLAIYDCEEKLLEATHKAMDKKINIYDIYTPFPVHGLDTAVGIKRSILPYVTLVAGLTGMALALALQVWISAYDWPTNIGGKPFISLPAFIPITFEFTVLLGAHTTVAAFLFINKLFPGRKPVIFDINQTSHTFVVAIEKEGTDIEQVSRFYKENGAIEVREQTQDLSLV